MTEADIAPAVEVEHNEAVSDPYSLILLYADSLNDIEKLRIATGNRLRALEDDKGMKNTPESRRLSEYHDRLLGLEKESVKEVERAMKAHPLSPMIKGVNGLGMKQTARLLAAIGDPGERETVGQLWAYCGMHVIMYCPECNTRLEIRQVNEEHPEYGQYLYCTKCEVQRDEYIGEAPKLTKGQVANWNSRARMRVVMIADSCIKQMNSPLRIIYDKGREQYADSINPKTGEKLSLLHQHNRARRLVAKEVLKLLWIEAKHQKGELSYSAIDYLTNPESVNSEATVPA